MALRYSIANAKIQGLSKVRSLRTYLAEGRKVFSLDLLSGHSCPFALQCLSKVKIVNGRRTIVDGGETIFRCFSATQEAAFTATYNRRAENFDSLRRLNQTQLTDTLSDALPPTAGIVRLHVGGEFWSARYFRAWCDVARLHADLLFYAYTKSLPYWAEYRREVPDNLVLTASYGGRHDAMIRSERFRFARVVYTVKGAGRLPLDHDDSHAADPTQRRRSFALLLHGMQPAGSEAGAAVRTLNGLGSYTRR